MTKNDVLHLSLPAVLLLTICVTAFAACEIVRRYVADKQSKETKFETFVRNIESGERQLTSEDWLEVVRRGKAVNKGQYELLETFSAAALVMGVGALIGLLFQIWAASHFRKRLKAQEAPIDSFNRVTRRRF